jgi:acyl carrier protein
VLPEIVALVARFAPQPCDAARVVPAAELVRDLGFDSVRLVELLLAVEDGFAVTLETESLLGGPPLSVGALAATVARARAAP